jgi:hypothetical protein
MPDKAEIDTTRRTELDLVALRVWATSAQKYWGIYPARSEVKQACNPTLVLSLLDRIEELRVRAECPYEAGCPAHGPQEPV